MAVRLSRMLESRIAIWEYTHGVRFHEQFSSQIYVEPSRCDQEVNLVPCCDCRNLPDKLRQGNAWYRRCVGDDSLRSFWVNAAGVGAHVILKKESVALKSPVDFFGRAEAVVETKLVRVALSWRTVPAACLPPIAVGAMLR